MPINIEVKAHAADWERQLALAASFGAKAETLTQEDTFFTCPNGWLKLRESGTATLIFYRRPSSKLPKASEYNIVDVSQPAGLKDVLAQAYGREKTVRKRRLLFLYDETRLHFDEVEGLGRFIEIEVVLKPGQTRADGQRLAQVWMERLKIPKSSLLAGAYADLEPPKKQAV